MQAEGPIDIAPYLTGRAVVRNGLRTVTQDWEAGVLCLVDLPNGGHVEAHLHLSRSWQGRAVLEVSRPNVIVPLVIFGPMAEAAVRMAEHIIQSYLAS